NLFLQIISAKLGVVEPVTDGGGGETEGLSDIDNTDIPRLHTPSTTDITFPPRCTTGDDDDELCILQAVLVPLLLLLLPFTRHFSLRR
ncbi:hypothetical protein BaRGS_00004244, partial [Batillaria attramentaria]